jgi:dTMP kinase
LAKYGRFITLEGGEGVGKSTLANALQAELVKRGITVVVTREPGGTVGAEALRRMILSPPDGVHWGALTEALLFYAARVDHLDKLIRPHVASGGWVICDRFSDSTRAYQAAAGGALAASIETLDHMCVGSSIPDLTLILDLPLSEARSRMALRDQARDAIERRGPHYHARVRQAFLDIHGAHADRCAVLDASQPPETVARDALAVIDQRLGDA